MTAMPTDKSRKPPLPPESVRQAVPESGAESVQQYLDLLLSSATEKTETLIDEVELTAPIVASLPAAADCEQQSNVPMLPKPITVNESNTSVKRRQRSAGTAAIPSEEVSPVQHRRRDDDIPTRAPYKEPRQPDFQMPLARPRLQTPVLPTASAPVLPTVAVPIEQRRVSESAPSPAAKPIDTSAQALGSGSQLTSALPAWAGDRFECLLFTVGGLTLAVPLTELGAIYPLTEEMTPIFGQVDWFLGLLPIKGRNIRVVNTPKVVMPERYCEAMITNFDYVISLNGVDWGLAVDGVTESVSLESGNIRWSSKRGKRPWLAGTVIEHMCALLDVSQLAAMFAEHESGPGGTVRR